MKELNTLCRARAIVSRVQGSTRHNGAEELAGSEKVDAGLPDGTELDEGRCWKEFRKVRCIKRQSQKMFSCFTREMPKVSKTANLLRQNCFAASDSIVTTSRKTKWFMFIFPDWSYIHDILWQVLIIILRI